MKIKNVAKGAAKLVGITFVAAAAIAVVTSGEALKSIGTGLQLAGEAVKKYVVPEKEEETAAAPAEPVEEPVEEVPAEEAPAEESDFAE